MKLVFKLQILIDLLVSLLNTPDHSYKLSNATTKKEKEVGKLIHNKIDLSAFLIESKLGEQNFRLGETIHVFCPKK